VSVLPRLVPPVVREKNEQVGWYHDRDPIRQWSSQDWHRRCPAESDADR